MKCMSLAFVRKLRRLKGRRRMRTDEVIGPPKWSRSEGGSGRISPRRSRILERRTRRWRFILPRPSIPGFKETSYDPDAADA